jgi:hypothetical protein
MIVNSSRPPFVPRPFCRLPLNAPIFAHHSVVLIQIPPLTKHGTAVRPLAHLPFVISLCHLSPEIVMFLCDPVRSRFYPSLPDRL